MTTAFLLTFGVALSTAFVNVPSPRHDYLAAQFGRQPGYDIHLKPGDVEIESIKPWAFNSDVLGSSKWRHAFFKQQNLICGFNSSNVHLFSQKIFKHDLSDRLFGFGVNRADEAIVDAVVFHRDDGLARLGIVSRSVKAPSSAGESRSFLREFKIGDNVKELFKLSLQGNPRALKFVCGLQGCAYAILFEHEGKMKIDQIHSKDGVNVFELRVHEAVSLSSVRLRGLRHLVVGSHSHVYVFRLNHFLTSFRLVSTIPYENLRSVAAFRSGPSAYLALSSDVRQRIVELRFDGGWKTIHELSEPLAAQFLSVYSVSFNTHVLALTTQLPKRPVVLFLFSGFSNELQEVRGLSINAPFAVLENSVATFSPGQQHVFLLFFDASAKHAALVDIKYNFIRLRAPLYELKQQATVRIEAAKTKLANHRSVLQKATKAMKHGAPKQAVLYRIPRNAKYNDIEVQGTVHTTLKPGARVGVVNSTIVINPDKPVVEEMTKKLLSLRKQLTQAKETLRNAVFKHLPQGPIRAAKKIIGNLQSPLIESQRASVDQLDREPAKKVIESLYFRDEGPRLRGKLIFHAGLSTPSITVSTLNGLDVARDIVLAGNDIQLFGEYNFTKGLSVKANSQVHGPLGQLSHTSKLMRVSDSAPPSLRRKDFDSVIVRESVEIHKTPSVNDVDLSKLSESLLNSESKQVVRTPIILHGSVSTRSMTVGTANGFTLNDPLKRFVYPDVPAVISGRKSFRFADCKNGLIARHTLNGLRIPEDLMLRHAEQRVTAPKTFAGGLKASSIIQRGLLNGFFFPAEVASLTEPSSIQGLVEFVRGVSFNSVNSRGPVDQLNIGEFMKEKKHNVRRSRPIIFHEAVTAGQVVVEGSIDGEDIRKTWNDIIPASMDPSASLEISGEKIFSAGLSAGEVYAPLINGLNIHEDLATVGKPIGGRKILRGNIYVNHLNSAKSIINGINVKAAFRDRVTLHTPQTISKPLILQDIRADRITVQRLLNGTSFPADFVTTNLPEFIKGDFRCNQLVIRSKNLHAREKISTPLVAGISSALKYRIPLNGTVKLDFVNLGNVESRFVDATLVDNEDFKNLAHRVLRTDEGKITLSGNNIFENLVLAAPFAASFVNGFDLARLDKRAVSTLKPTTIRVPISFHDPIVVKGPLQTSTINAQHAAVLNSIASKKDTHIAGPVRFRKKVRSVGAVDARFVNGAVLGRDFLTLRTPQTISSNIAFGGTVFVKDRLDGVPTINGVNLQRLEKSLVQVSHQAGPIFVNSPLIFEAPVRLEKHLHAAHVNGENLRALVANAACMAEGVLHSLEIKGPLILTHGAVVHNYNGRANLPQRMAQIVFDDGNTYRLTNTTFQNLRVEGIVQCKQMQHDGFLNEVPVGDVLREAIPTSSRTPLRFPGSLVVNAPITIDDFRVDGRVNGIRFPEGVLRRCTNCGVQKLRNVTVHTMDVPRIIPGRADHPSSAFWNTIKNNKVVGVDDVITQILNGQRGVDNFIVEGNLETKAINGKQFTERLARTDGYTVLESPVFAEASFDHLTLRSPAATNCSSKALACSIRSLQKRNCFDWHSQIPRFHNVIFEKGVRTERINGVDLRPARQRRQAAIDTLSLRIVDAQNALEKVRYVNEHLLDC